MAPPRKILKQQLEILVDYLEENKDISGPTPLTTVGLQNTKMKWGIVAQKLNSVEGGAKKPPENWKKYWIEWRHKCRKKATYMSTHVSHNLTFSDLEVRTINISNKNETFAPSKKIEIFLEDNLNNEQQYKLDTDQNVEDIKVSRKRKLLKESSHRSTTPPPEWAIELEERRIAAEERIANALETIATTMQAQEERRSLVEERIVDTLATIAGNLQELNNSVIQKNNLQQEINHETETSPTKDVLFLIGENH